MTAVWIVAYPETIPPTDNPNDKLRPLVEARGGIWEELPTDTFIGAGTGVRTVLLMLDA